MQTVIYAVTVRCVLNGTVKAVYWVDECVRTLKHEKDFEINNWNIDLQSLHLSFQSFIFSGR